MAKTFKELLDEALEKIGMKPSELGEALGRKYGYQGYYDLTSGRTKLTEEKLEEVAKIVRVPVAYFGDPQLFERREQHIRDAFAQFMTSDVAKDCDPEILEIIERIPFHGPRLPTKALYQSIAVAMATGRYSTEQLLAAVVEKSDPPPVPPKVRPVPKPGE
jgi:hypothetical protein